LKIANP
jgi:hypothetical protein